jgi:hypothetical protein
MYLRHCKDLFLIKFYTHHISKSDDGKFLFHMHAQNVTSRVAGSEINSRYSLRGIDSTALDGMEISAGVINSSRTYPRILSVSCVSRIPFTVTKIPEKDKFGDMASRRRKRSLAGVYSS